MKDIRLLEFDTPNDFTDLHNVVELHTKQDTLWAEEMVKV
jgi:hypothetical protein